MRTETFLECNHVVLFSNHSPQLRVRIWCTRCQDMRVVVGRTGDYQARCRDCARLDIVRSREEIAKRLVWAHLRGHPKHRVILAVIGTTDRWTVTLSEPDKPTVTDTPLPKLIGFDSQGYLF